jgi:hypothetical protein
MTSETFRVMSIKVDGVVLDDFDFASATLRVIGPVPDFVLDFRTAGGHNLRPAQAELEIVVSDSRTYRGNGNDAMPNPWSHHYVNGLGVPGWA